MAKIARRTAPDSVDRARQMLCRHVLQWCEQGATNIKARVNTAEGLPQAVWFYGHVDNEWMKLPETVEGPETSRLIADELQRLAANPHSEECQIRRKTLRDRVEFEIKFHHDKIVAHHGKNLSSYLFGILFHEQHAATNPRRQAIRRGPKRSAART